jgi:hypothetical protein
MSNNIYVSSIPGYDNLFLSLSCKNFVIEMKSETELLVRAVEEKNVWRELTQIEKESAIRMGLIVSPFPELPIVDPRKSSKDATVPSLPSLPTLPTLPVTNKPSIFAEGAFKGATIGSAYANTVTQNFAASVPNIPSEKIENKIIQALENDKNLMQSLIDMLSFETVKHSIHDNDRPCYKGDKYNQCDDCYSGDTEFEHNDDMHQFLKSLSKIVYKDVENVSKYKENASDDEDASEGEESDE